MGLLPLLWLMVASAGCRGRQFERAAVREAAEYGLRRMNELVLVQEPRLFKMGMWLDRDDPARYVAAFNDQSEQAKRLAGFGYAALQASSKLIQRVYEEEEGRGYAPRMPAISLVNTPLYEQCPLRQSPACPPDASRYRSLGGVCNNPAHPSWGAAFMPQRRFLPPHYRDGLERIRDSVSGGALPSARAVSSAIHGDRDVELGSVSHMVMQWGQFLDHDLTATAQSRGFNGSVPKCCSDGGRNLQPPDLTHPDCLPISVPPEDRFYSHYGVQCLEFVRSSPAPRVALLLGPRDQINQVTSFIDGSVVYGSNDHHADQLRLHRSGLLRYSRVQYRLPLLPPSPHRAELCRGAGGAVRCFWAGDGRVNEQPGLAAMHTLWLRAHNRLATELSHLNPRWGDHKLYHEARRLVAAMMQHVTYAEFLPIVLGEDVMKMFELQLQRKGYYDGYDITVDPSVANEFGAAAFRFGHSLVQRSLVRGDRNHHQLRSNVSLHEELTNPGNLYNIGSVDRLLMGMCMQPSQKRDEFITEQLTNHLFQTPRFHYGMDLAAINIQRGRDHGLAPYNAWRETCGLHQFSDWHDLLRVMSADTLRKLQSVYRDVNDIDLFPGGMAERPVSGGLVGPTFACIIAQQFRNLRKGDRFWYENAEFESSFTPAQLQQLRKVTLARILCDNLDTIDTIQPFVFLMSDHDRNPYVSCDSRLIPQFDLKPWQEQKKESHTHYPAPEIHPGAGYPSAKPDDEAGELPFHPSSGSQQRPQQEQVLPAFLIDEDIIDEDNSASTSESIVPAYLVDNDKLQSSESLDHHYTTESVEPSYLIDDKFQQSKPPHPHYTTEGTKPSYLIDDKFQQTKPPHHHYTTKGTKPSYFIDDKFQQSKQPQHHFTTEGTKPSYLIDDKFQQSKPPQQHYTTKRTKPPHLIDDKFQQSKPHHHYTTESIKPSYLVDDKFQQSHKPNHPYTTESPNIPSRPSIIIIEDKFVRPPMPIDSKPSIEVITTHPQNSYLKPHSPGPNKPHDNYGETDYNSPALDTPIYIIIPGKEPQPETSSHYKPHGHNHPDKYHSTRPPGIKESTLLRPSHFYEEYPLNESNEYRTTTQRPNYYGGPYRYSPKPSHITGINANSRPYSFIERYNEPSYYYYGDKKGQASGYLKYAGLWLPDEDPHEEHETEMKESSQEEQNTETSIKLEEYAEVGVSTENYGTGDNSTTDNSDDEWSFNMADVDEDSKLPEMPSIAADPQALFEVPQPLILYDEEEFGSGDDSQSLA